MSASVETITNTTKKQKLNNGSPLSTMSVQNPTPTPVPAAASPAPATPAPATPIPTNGVQPQAPAQWAQIPIDPALQNAQPYPQYAWPPQPTGAPTVGSPAPNATTITTTAATPQPIRAKTSTPAPAASSPAPTTAPGATTTPAPAPAPGTTTATPYAASPYYPPGYRYPYPYQGQPQYTYTYANGQYYAVPQQVPQPTAATTAQTTAAATPTATAATTPAAATAARVMMPTAASSATTNSTAQAVAGVGQPMQQQPTSQLNDALAGIVDLRAEEDALSRGHQDVGSAYYHREGDRSKRVGPALESSKLWMSEKLKAILSAQGLTNLPEEALNYAMLAWKARLQMLWDKALAAAEHRYSSQYSRPPSFWNPPPADGSAPNANVPPTPMWSTVVKRDVSKQLSAIERAEKEEETRARRERRTAAAQAEADDAVEDDDADGRKAKKIRALGPGVTARMMPEDVKKKMSDNTANRAAGLGTGKYAWMTAGATGGAAAAPTPPKPKPTPAPTPAPTANATGATTTPAPTTATTPAPKAGGWGRAYAAVSKTTTGTDSKDDSVTVTLRDALFVASRERGYGGGRGSALATAGKWE
ncbi:Transcription initiation factor TFIID component TAF4 family [Rhizoctonia solani]|uniref:Transcription initiation factor TFIID subunit 4 n=1 Tax=Rhizoctonia solani TaxID=456999 RepID=A0A8H7GZP8_9AGAM|nr:Transcription initiation factor TFIID component TAF4 family [Rhizoctonia solani]